MLRPDPVISFFVRPKNPGGLPMSANPLSGSLFSSSGKMDPLGSNWRVRRIFPPRLLVKVYKQVSALIVEFVIYNIPGPHGMTPRDIDRRWSMALPLEKEL